MQQAQQQRLRDQAQEQVLLVRAALAEMLEGLDCPIRSGAGGRQFLDWACCLALP